MDKVGLASEPEGEHRCSQVRCHGIGGDERPPGGMAGEARFFSVTEAPAQARPQAVGSDQGKAMFRERLRGAPGDRDAALVEGKVLDPDAEAKDDVGIGAHGVDQHRLQVAAMDHPIGRAIAFRSGGAERRARQHPRRARVDYAEFFGSNDVALQVVAQAECNQDARGVGGELDAGPDLFQALRLLEHGDAKSMACEGQGRSETADARAGDEDGARGRHGPCLRRGLKLKL